MKWRRYVGVDMQCGEIRVVALRRRWRKGGQLVGSQICSIPSGSFPEDLRRISPSFRQTLVTTLHDVLPPVVFKERRVALSLPDHCGYVMTLDIEKFPRLRGEGKQVVAWQLGKVLPGLSDLQFDYQVLTRSGGGSVRLLVIAAEKEVVSCYEDLFGQAGFIPEHIGFYGLNVYRHWRYRLDPEGDAILVSLNQEGIIVQSYRDGVLEYYRARPVGGQLSRQVQELHRIVAGYGREFSGRGRSRAYLHADKPLEHAALEALNECFGRKVHLLEGHADSPPALAAALGAAERMMMGG